jgi:FkbM family methyltransferase
LRRLLFAITRPRWTLPTGLQVCAENLWDWTVYEEIFLRGCYDVAIRRAITSMSPGDPLHVLDLGSNLGFFTLRVVDLLRQAKGSESALNAILVDASAAAVAESRRRLQEENSLSARITWQHGLLGKRSGADCLSHERIHLFSSLHRTTRAGERVEYVDLEPLSASMPRVDLLKCDIEGAELAFLEHYPALLAKSSTVSLELHHNLIDTARCRALLDAAGFTEHTEISVEPESSIYTAWR